MLDDMIELSGEYSINGRACVVHIKQEDMQEQDEDEDAPI